MTGALPVPTFPRSAETFTGKRREHVGRRAIRSTYRELFGEPPPPDMKVELHRLDPRRRSRARRRLGTGKGIRDYEWILDDQYLMFHHASVRMPQDKSPARLLGVASDAEV